MQRGNNVSINLGEFFQQLVSNPMLAVTVVLTLGVILVNGWTDAPNAIATCVSTRSWNPYPDFKVFPLAVGAFSSGVTVMDAVRSAE